MKPGSTHISVILDRSGSMEEIRTDTIGGFNAFLAQQKAEPGTATLTLVQFDTLAPYEVIHRFKPLAEIPNLDEKTFVPRGGTPLLDALGMGINDIDRHLDELVADERPSKVVVVVVTDGLENSSHEFSRKRIETMVKEKTEEKGWQFVFLSADLAAFEESHGLGFQALRAMRYHRSAEGSERAWGAMSRRMADYRGDRATQVEFDGEDRVQPDDPAPEKA